MAIDYSKLRSVTAREIVGALIRDGFTLKRTKGSHRRYVHTDGRRVTVSYHTTSDTFPPKTLRSMIEEQAGWDEDNLEQLGLLP